MPWPELPAKSVTLWFTDTRKVALIAFVTGVLSLPTPFWNEAQHWTRIESMHRPWWMAALILSYLFSALMPAFCFALYRNEQTLRPSVRLRMLSLAAALTIGALVLIGLPSLVRSLGLIGSSSVLTTEREPWSMGDLAALLTEFSSVAYILLLLALFRRVDHEANAQTSVSRLLSIVTKVVVVAWGFRVAVLLIRLIFTPYSHSLLENYALQVGAKPPQLRDMMAEAIRALLTQACIFVAPFVVHSSLSRRR